MRKLKWFGLVGVCLLVAATLAWGATAKKFYYGIKLREMGSPGTPESGYLHAYVDTSGVFKVVNDEGSTISLATGSGDNTLDNAYDQGGDGAGRTITADTGSVTITNTDADAAFVFELTPTPSAGAALGGAKITVGANSTEDALQIANSGSGDDIQAGGGSFTVSAAAAVAAASLTTSSDVTVGGDLSVTGSYYAADIAAAASGNANLTLNAAGNGTVSIGNLSTGAVKILNAALDIGDSANDTLTITSVIDGNVTLDDGTTDSPSLILKDATDETGTFTKVDGSHTTFTPNAANQALQVLSGNFRVGNGNPGTAAMDGEDAYVEGELEVDGSIQFDGALTCASTLSVAGTSAFSENMVLTAAADEYLQIDAATTDSTTTAGVLDINFDSVTNGGEGANIKATFVAGGGGSEVISGLVIDLDDDSDAAGTLVGVDIQSSDATGSSAIYGIRLGNALEQGINATNAAAAQTFVIDATTAAQTSTSGSIFDISYRTATATAQAINLDVESDVVGGASEVVEGIHIQMDDDANTNTDEIHGIEIDTDGDGTGLQHAIYVGGAAGIDAALYAANGYVRIGTGSTPDVTPGDDDLYVEGTAEIDGDIRFDATLNLAPASELTISGGVITAVKSYHDVDTEGDAASDDLDTINGGSEGDILIIRAENTGRTVVVKDGTGNIKCGGDRSLDNIEDTITLIYDGAAWLEMAFANNGA